VRPVNAARAGSRTAVNIVIVSIPRNTAGSFASARVLAAGNRPHDLVLARWDADARPDLAVIAFDSSRLTVITNPGAATRACGGSGCGGSSR
jgi:hypothetical protein